MLGERLIQANKIAKKLRSYFWTKLDINRWGEDHRAFQLGRYRKLRKHYPCWMCGNPRRWFGEKTRQEKIAELDKIEDEECYR